MTDAITTERLTIRPFTAADGDVVVSGLNDFEVVKWLATPPHPFGSNDLRLVKADGSSRWPELAAICLDGTVIGGISGMPHFGYWLLQEHWARGFATEAGAGMLNWVFSNTDEPQVTSGYFEGNPASARVLEKFGFEETGRGNHFCRSRNQDLPHVELRLTRATWGARQ